MAAPASYRRTPSVHSIRLDEEEQLQIALALSAEEAGLIGGGAAAATAEDERLARELQEAEYEEAARDQQQQPHAGLPVSMASTVAATASAGLTSSSSPSPDTLPADGSSTSSGSGRVVDDLRVASRSAMQRISSGSQQLWQGLKRMVDPQPAPPPYYQPPALWQLGQQQQQYPQAPLPGYTPGSAQGPWAPPPPGGSGPSWQGPQQQLTEDEALAQALQRQFDLEDQQQQQLALLAAPMPATGPLGANLAATTAATAAVSRPHAGTPAPTAQPPSFPSQPATASARPQQPATAAAAWAEHNSCGGCGGSLFGLLGARSSYIAALGRSWHPGCLVCAACKQPIGERGGVPFCQRDGLLYHCDCHRAKFHPRCDVCGDYCPGEANRRIVWSEIPFWHQRFCPDHAYDGTPRCTACDCLRPHAQADSWAELEDGRHICLPCLDTIITDTRDAQPLWQNVLSFYAGKGMPLPVVPPMMLVDSGALNKAEGQETHGRGRGTGPMFHVRGLTLTEEYTSIRTILRIPGGNPFTIQRHAVPVGPMRCEVTGILVLYGLPRLLTGSILAHECMHAWLRMSGLSSHQHLLEQVEEGLCQLMAYLWLEAQQSQTGFRDDYEGRLAAFCAHQIRSDTSATYGDGFRLAHAALQTHGLQELLAHVQRLGAFPA